MIKIDIHHSPSLDAKIEDILDRLDHITSLIEIVSRFQRRIMASQEELLQELGEINAVTDELANDVEQLIQNQDDPARSEEIKTQLTALKSKLQNIAVQYPPVVPEVDPNDPNAATRGRRK